jgi:serine protease Do
MKGYLLIGTCLILGGMGTYAGRSLLMGDAPGDAPAVARDPTSYRDIVKKVLPAVVSLEAQAKGGKSRPRRPGDAQQPDEDRSQVGFGSGFLISPKGVIVTNNHVVEGADRVVVRMASGKKFIARTIRTDAKTDMAILQLDIKENLPYLEFGDSDQMEIGDRVLAVGAPFGLAGTVTHGIISSKGRALKMNLYEDFLQTDAAINPGNSGGPLVNMEGKVIGITSAIKSRSGGFQGIGLAIASNLGKAIADKLLKDGVVRRGYLGVGIRDVNEEIAREAKLDRTTGVQVTRLYRDAPGEKAGLEKGDVVVSLGGKPVKDSRSLQTVVAGLPTGKPVEIEVIRDGKTKKLSVTIEEQPETFGSTKADPQGQGD